MTDKVEKKSEGRPQRPERPPLPPKVVLVEKVTGIVKWFNVRSGYGFIQRDDTKEDIFCHRTAIPYKNSNKKHFLRSLDTDEKVEFQVVEGRQGEEAWTVTGPKGGRVRGSEFAPIKWWLRPDARTRRPRRSRSRRRTTITDDEDKTTTKKTEKKTSKADTTSKDETTSKASVKAESKVEEEGGKSDDGRPSGQRRKRRPKTYAGHRAEDAPKSVNTNTASSKATDDEDGGKDDKAAPKPRRDRHRQKRRAGPKDGKGDGKASPSVSEEEEKEKAIVTKAVKDLVNQINNNNRKKPLEE